MQTQFEPFGTVRRRDQRQASRPLIACRRPSLGLLLAGKTRGSEREEKKIKRTGKVEQEESQPDSVNCPFFPVLWSSYIPTFGRILACWHLRCPYQERKAPTFFWDLVDERYRTNQTARLLRPPRHNLQLQLNPPGHTSTRQHQTALDENWSDSEWRLTNACAWQRPSDRCRPAAHRCAASASLDALGVQWQSPATCRLFPAATGVWPRRLGAPQRLRQGLCPLTRALAQSEPAIFLRHQRPGR